MSDEQDKLKLSLEPPKLFGRKKKSAGKADASEPATDARPAADTSESAPVAEHAEEQTTASEEVEPAPVDDPADAELTALIEDVQAAEASPIDPPPEGVAEDTAAAEPDVEADPVVEAEPEHEPMVDAGSTPVVDSEPVVEAEPAVEAEPVVETVAVSEPRAEDTAVLDPVADQPPLAALEPEPEPARKRPGSRNPLSRKTAPSSGATRVDVEPEPVNDTDLEDAEIAAMADRGPLLTSYRAAVVTGLAVGAAMVVLTWLSLRGCEAVRGTASCGGGPGFLLLVATFVICVLLGSALLKAFDVPDPGSSSFLAVGLVAVVALLFLIDFLDSWVMLIVIPIISVGGYLASVWVTKTFVDPGEV